MSGWSNQAVSLLVLTEETGGYSGAFGYSPAPGSGDLRFSVSASAGTDPDGDQYLAGIVGYIVSGVTKYAVVLGDPAGGIQFYQAASESAGWTLDASINDGNGVLELSSGAADYIWAKQQLACTDPSDTTAPAAWNQMSLNSAHWTTVAGQQTPMYRYDALGNVQFAGQAAGTSVGNGTSLASALPSGYYSTTYPRSMLLDVISGTLATGQTPRLVCSTSGVLSLAGFSGAADATVCLDGMTMPLSAG